MGTIMFAKLVIVFALIVVAVVIVIVITTIIAIVVQSVGIVHIAVVAVIIFITRNRCSLWAHLLRIAPRSHAMRLVILGCR